MRRYDCTCWQMEEGTDRILSPGPAGFLLAPFSLFKMARHPVGVGWHKERAAWLLPSSVRYDNTRGSRKGFFLPLTPWPGLNVHKILQTTGHIAGKYGELQYNFRPPKNVHRKHPPNHFCTRKVEDKKTYHQFLKMAMSMAMSRY